MGTLATNSLKSLKRFLLLVLLFYCLKNVELLSSEGVLESRYVSD